MPDQVSRTADEAGVRGCIESWTRALHAKDIDRVMSHYTTDIVTFDMAPPLRHAGEEYRRATEMWFHTWRSPIGLEVRDLRVTVDGDVAFSTSLNHLTGARTDGTHTDVWMRATVCFRKVDGRWLAAHEHVSVPFYMDGSERAATDLKP